ncbi:spermidine synthase [Bacillus thuringiensis]|uniref:spermidine synthase n=1 Tax=Bacillus thuringiensis TaxID=1428 RepID=UPI0021D65C67|nr:hypothetical protein [Bacillus thuringiensis]MCU7668529.1 hypothetical protein [Bacillus thuringiensis]
MNSSNFLYSDNNFFLNSPQSLLKNDSIYTGNQPDDFGLAGYIANGNKVLVLGLGFGSAIRAVLSTLPEAEITVVDINPNIIRACKGIYEYLFPNINIEYINGDDRDIKTIVKGKFDLICVDIYTEDGCPEFMCGANFWLEIKSILNEKGIMITNTWGLPTHLNPLDGELHQNFILKNLFSIFQSNYLLPFRRNITVISSEEKQLSIKKPNIPVVSNEDKIIITYLKYKLLSVKRITNEYLKNEIENNNLKHSSVDKEMEVRHLHWIHSYSKLINELSKINVEKQNLSNLIKNELVAKKLTIKLLEQNSYSIDIVPNFMGSLAFENDNEIAWYLDWIIHDYKKLFELNKYWFVNVALCQFFSIISNPFYNMENKYTNEIQGIFNFLENNLELN